MVGKFLRDQEGGIVAIQGSPVLAKKLEKKPNKDCKCIMCGFTKWSKGDTCFIVQHFGGITGGDDTTTDEYFGKLRYYCPDCALELGLPPEHYKCNKRSKKGSGSSSGQGGGIVEPSSSSLLPIQYVPECTTVSRGMMYNSSDLVACFCYF